MRRESTGFARTLGVYFTIAFAALQALDVLLDRLGLPERLFMQASVAVVLFLPAAVAVGLIRRFVAQEDGPALRERPRWLERSSSVADVHLRLARLHERRGDEERALRHYERYLELVERVARAGDSG